MLGQIVLDFRCQVIRRHSAYRYHIPRLEAFYFCTDLYDSCRYLMAQNQSCRKPGMYLVRIG